MTPARWLPRKPWVQWLDEDLAPASFPYRPVARKHYRFLADQSRVVEINLHELRRPYVARDYRRSTGGFDGCP